MRYLSVWVLAELFLWYFLRLSAMRISIDFFYLAVLLSAIAWSTKGALRFTEKPSNNVFAEKGTTVILKWDYSADNKSAELQNIIWTAGISVLMYENSTGYWKISGAIPSSYVGRVSKEGRAFLVIKGVTFEDSGSYTCTLEANPGVTQDKTSTVNLVVTGVEPKIHFRKVDNSATFTCNATGIPSQNFTWTKLGSKVEIVNDARHSVDFLSGSSVLTIKIITVEDQAYYICNATIGDDQQNLGLAYLQLVSDMSLSYESCPNLPYNVRVGRRELKLCCPVGGYPKPTITWERNGIQLQKSENPLYFISNVQREDFGNYTCTATDGKSVIASAVSVRDKIANLPVETTDGTDKEAANLKWTQQTGADYYMVAINGADILADVLIGKQTSLEVHYHTLVMKNNREDAPETTVCVEVSALNSTAGVIAKTKDPSCKTMVIKKTSDTVY